MGITTARQKDAEIIRILEVVDTRDYMEEGDRWVPIPGSGAPNQCDRCGRTHEVHARVILADGANAIVGTGCMGKDSVAKEARSLAMKARRRIELTSALEKVRQELTAAVGAWARVEALPAPPIEEGIVRTLSDGTEQPIIRCGDAEIWLHSPATRTVREDVVRCWRGKRFLDSGARDGYLVRETIRSLEKKLARLGA